ncbi:MAG: hypothetical protein M1823_005005 [Watsoniomyces obsoletus]|nr:MAG: hypothetical protein M1823_005005 [Watsoniomyces obsoletus]
MADMEAELEMLRSMQALNDVASDYSINGGVEANQEHMLPTAGADQADPLQESTTIATATTNISAEDSVARASAQSMYTAQDLVANSTETTTMTTNERATADVQAQAASPPTSADPAHQPSSSTGLRVLGGFVIDEEDEYDDATDAAASGSAGLSSGANAMPGLPIPVSPGPSTTTPAAGDVTETTLPQPDGGDNQTSANSHITDAPVSRNGTTQGASTGAASTGTSKPTVTRPRVRLPNDIVGMLEDRIKEDPRGDMDAWLSLIAEHRRRNRLQDARAVYDRFFKVFPMAAEQYLACANMALDHDDATSANRIFSEVLTKLPSLPLWKLYLDYVRRINNLTTDTTGEARAKIVQAFELTLQHVGLDKDSGHLWLDYVQFLRSGPGNVGGSNWQDQQKMDQLRKAYQRGICIPTAAVNTLWKEYDAFEKGLNRITAPRFLQEKSPSYMTARSCNIELDNITRGLIRTTLPVFPPAEGFAGDEEYRRQVALWQKWIQWEKDDPLVLRDDDRKTYNARVIYVYKQAVMALRFWPEIWFEAADFCYQQKLHKQGNEFLTQGFEANPESSLLAFKRADRLEAIASSDQSEAGANQRAAMIREPYERLLDALYDLATKVKDRETREVADIEEQFRTANFTPASDDEDDREAEMDAREAAKQARIKLVQEGSESQSQVLSHAITHAWIALMRAMRRVEGRGRNPRAVGGFRTIFAEARKRGKLTSDLYVAAALIEHHCYQDPSGLKIFERAIKLYPKDEYLVVQYLKHLISINDFTNARAVFEMAVGRLSQTPETLPKAKPVYAYFHELESHYGEQAQIAKLEQRIANVFPDDPKLSHFSARFTFNGIDPLALRPIISPATQTRPKAMGSVGMERVPTGGSSGSSAPGGRAPSPKRAFQSDDSDHDAYRPRKMMRGESPLRGAAGRRMGHQERYRGPGNNGPQYSRSNDRHHNHQHSHQHQHSYQSRGPSHLGMSRYPPPPAPLPRDISILLSILPRVELYPPDARFNPDSIVRMIQNVQLPSAAHMQALTRNWAPPMSGPPPPASTSTGSSGM